MSDPVDTRRRTDWQSVLQRTNSDPAREPNRSAVSDEPVLGVTRYDQLTSGLISLILVFGLLTLGFGAIWAANLMWGVLTPRPPANVVFDEFPDEGGGGEESGDRDEDPSGPGGLVLSTGATPEEVISDALSAEQNVTSLLTALTPAVEMSDTLMVGPDFGSSLLSWGNINGKNPRPKQGIGEGKLGGAKRQNRWQISFDPGQTEQEYARQLDYFGVELGAIVNGKLYLASKLSSDKPVVREVAKPDQEKRLYFSWRGGSRRQADINLLHKAGAPVGDGDVIVLQFYSTQTEQQLARLELSKAQPGGRAFKDGKLHMESVRKTSFAVVKTESGYDFEITKIEYFGDTTGKR